MPDASPAPQLCRTCGKPRGENIAEGTRCADCGRRQALQLCLAGGIGGAGIAFAQDAGLARAPLAGLVVAASLPVAFTITVLLHEVSHAVAATLLGQTVVRVIVGEGRALFRLGREPQLIVGRVVMGNGVTSTLDLRPAGYRWRTCVMLLVAPMGSLLLAATAWNASDGWGLAARSAGITFAACNLAMAVVTLLPVPTFGGRVWSDLAHALFIVRAGDAEIAEQMALAVRDCMAAQVERGDLDRAIDTARAAVDVAPRSVLAQSLLAFALHTAGRRVEAGAVARAALRGEMDAVDRAYLLRVLDDVEAQSALDALGPREQGSAPA